ncbi:hypothetical protein EJB05_12281, partial [Eragrostis curvula]
MLLRRAATAAAAANRSLYLTRARVPRRAGAAGRGHATASTSTSSSPPRRRGNRRAPPASAEDITATAAPRPFPDYHPPRPDSPADDDLARRLAAAVLASPDPVSLPPLPFLSHLRPIHLLLALPLLASHPHLARLLLPLLLLFPSRPKQHPHPHLLRCFAVAAHLAAVRDAGAARAILVRAVRFPSPHRHFVEHFISTYKAFSSNPASFDILLQCLPSAPLLRRLRQYGISPSPEACNPVLSRLPLDEAIELFQELPDKNVCSYNILLKALCSAGRLKDALQLFDEMALPPDVVTYGILIHGYCALDDLDNAVKLLDEMVARGVEPNATVYTSVIALLCEKGRVSDSLRVVEDMVQRKVTLDEAVYTTVLSGFCSKGDLAAARRWFDEMQKKGLATDRVTYTTMISGLCQAGELNEAERVFQGMLARRLDVDEDVAPNENTYNILIKGHCKARNMKEALYFHSEMIEKGFRLAATSYNALVRLLNKKKKFVEARKLFDEMRKEGLTADPDVYNFYIDLNFNEDNLESTLALCDELVESSVVTSKADLDQHNCVQCEHKIQIHPLLAMLSLQLRQHGVLPENVKAKWRWNAHRIVGAICMEKKVLAFITYLKSKVVVRLRMTMALAAAAAL